MKEHRKSRMIATDTGRKKIVAIRALAGIVAAGILIAGSIYALSEYMNHKLEEEQECCWADGATFEEIINAIGIDAPERSSVLSR
ncbi:hypothetical protein JGS22_002820 [Streptomyces sp. P38-E01]|uniref:Uncharacterized protein n=1 Tax=Streptomyces tardus TaxID=2780544 RepID=A0A949JK22_9ACTN|nr:hypothetical protein [Streptomyces tardus]MBU7596596.1 hypothetical protein [Streptomyces tardus]